MEPSLENYVPTLLSSPFPADQHCCSLCLSAPARYTCPRCNAPYCSLSCYRGGRHRGCSEAFYRGEVLQGLQEAGAGRKGDIEGILKRMREAQLLEEELQASSENAEDGEEELCVEEGTGQEDKLFEAECSLDEESLDTQTLWQKLTPEEQQDFERLLENDGLGALLQLWNPWWETPESSLLVQEVGQTHEKTQQQNEAMMTTLEQSSKGRVTLFKEKQDWEKVETINTTDVMSLKRSKMKKQQGGQGLHQNDRFLNSKSFQTDVSALTENCASGKLSPPTKQNNASALFEVQHSAGLLQQSRTQGVLKKEKTNPTERILHKELLGVPPNTSQTPIPHVRLPIPPLCSLACNPSPLVRFTLVNVLYSYAFSLKLYNGDLGEDFLLQGFCNTVLAVSGALSSTSVFDSTAAALQAGIQAVLTTGSHGDPDGAAAAVSNILRGVSQSGRKNYTLAALSHLADILLKARSLAPKEKKHFIFSAKKKCDFLLSWVNENEDSLPLLSSEVQSEYKRYVSNLKEVGLITRQLEKSWGGNKPPEKKMLIYELD